MPNVFLTTSMVGIEPPILSIRVWFWCLRPPHQQGIPVDEYSDGELAVPEFDFISHPHGGWVFDSPEAQTNWKSFVKKNKWFEECSSSNPYHPWRHEGELWLSGFLYRQTQISMK